MTADAPSATALEVHVIETSTLGDRSYLATDGVTALVVDPQRDIDRVLLLAGRLGVQIAWIVETHIHNDYVSGGLALARITGARYGVAAADPVTFDRVPLADGDEVTVSDRMSVRVVATPGHTAHHLSYALVDAATSIPVGVFTGGSLLFGTTGRTDLSGADNAEPLARAQYGSARRLADLLPDGAAVWPTHGFGSFCSAGGGGGDASTIGAERTANPALLLAEDDFVHEMLAGLDAWPAYYSHMGAPNLAGGSPIDLTAPAIATPEELQRRLDAGEWVVDLRHRKAYAAAHLVGTISLGLDGSMATWLGWLMDFGTPLTLLGETPADITAAQRELARIGIDRPAAAATGDVADWAGSVGDVGTLHTATFRMLAAARAETADAAALPAPDVVLDIRLRNEWLAGHVAGAVHVPLYDLARQIDELPTGAVWIYCGSGYRATAAAGMLERAGRTVVVVDDVFADAADSGVEVVTGP
jgi:glyoxylase-like metal-dependent hydrolase (beta-lactamase superfamily II)/rhodanese-related sulfurtransferase